jgi:hypothetical protein
MCWCWSAEESWSISLWKLTVDRGRHDRARRWLWHSLSCSGNVDVSIRTASRQKKESRATSVLLLCQSISVAASTGVQMVGGTVGHKSPSNIFACTKQYRSQPVMPCLAIRRSLHVGRCVCVCEPTGFVNSQRIHTHSFSLPGCLWMRTASKSTLPLPVAEPGHFLSAICASRNISSSLYFESRYYVLLLLRILKKECVEKESILMNRRQGSWE